LEIREVNALFAESAFTYKVKRTVSKFQKQALRCLEKALFDSNCCLLILGQKINATHQQIQGGF